MTVAGSKVGDEVDNSTGDEAGTAPGDRRFRPDVEGLRAVAVGLVVLFHAGLPSLTGGYVGVDVFFVISGFVITGLLLRERNSTGGTSVLDFYARRVRRILPAATLVILVTVAASYIFLGVVSGNSAANDGRWAAAFLSNFHFAATGTNYLTAFLPPSPLQNYWSLSVEEQFYLVFPTLFLLVAGAKGALSIQKRMTVVLVGVIIFSFGLSVIQTASSPAAAYFSPFTRAWELALGGLIAVSTSLLRKLPINIAAVMTWVGLGMIVLSAFQFNALTAYPGSAVAVPVLGAGLVIAGGVVARGHGAELVLGTGPFQWLGRRSYSLYLWHWPILIIAAEHVDKATLPFGENLGLLVIAGVLAAATFHVVENPIRHWRLPSRRSVVAGLILVVATVVFLSLVIGVESSPAVRTAVIPAANAQVVSDQVAASTRITRVPTNIRPPLAIAGYDFGSNFVPLRCTVGEFTVAAPICTYGDSHGQDLMVLYGDSHAEMWMSAFRAIATAAHVRLVVLARAYCPASPVTIVNLPVWGNPNGPDTVCDKWHQWAINWINAHKPNLLVITQENFYKAPNVAGQPPTTLTDSQWHEGLVRLFQSIHLPRSSVVYLGNTPTLPKPVPQCLAAHTDDVQVCAAPARTAEAPKNRIDRSVTLAAGVKFVDPTPWFCDTKCTAIISHFVVYVDTYHITTTYALYLEIVLARALGLSTEGIGPTVP